MADLILPPNYMDDLATRAGITRAAQDFLRRNPIDLPKNVAPEHMSRSERQMFAMRELLLKSAPDATNLWVLLAAFAENAGGEMTFSQATLRKFLAPKNWPAVTADGEGNVTVKLGQFAGVTSDKQLALPLEVAQ